MMQQSFMPLISLLNSIGQSLGILYNDFWKASVLNDHCKAMATDDV
jgi:hypothetical protein